MRIAAVIVIYKTSDEIVENLKGELVNVGVHPSSIYVVDNTKKNTGYAHAANDGIRRALKDNADIVIIANPDVSIKNLTKQNILATAQKFDIAGFAMQQNNTIFYGGVLDLRRMSGGLLTQKPKDKFSLCDFVSGSLMIINRNVFKTIGFLKEDFFMYYEDVEYCHRARQAGLTVGLDSTIVYDHFETSSLGAEKKYLLARNRFLFLWQYGSFIQKAYELVRLPKTIYEERTVIVHYIMKDRFLLNFASLSGSSLIIKLLNFILFIFLIRYLRPNEYGIYTLVWAHVTLLAPLVDFGTTSYGIVYLPTEKKSMFNSVFSLRLMLSLVVFTITILLAHVFRYDNAIFLYIFLASFVVFSNMSSGSFLIINSLREKIVISSVLSICFNVLLIAGLVLSIVVTKSLLTLFFLIFIFYNLYAVVVLGFLKRELPSLRVTWQTLQWFKIVKKSYVFVLIGFFAGIYFKIDVFLLNLLKGQTEVGIYSAGYKFFEALLFIPGSYNISSTPILARLHVQDTQGFMRKIKKDIIMLSFIGFSIAVGVLFLGPFVLPYILKNMYADSIRVAQITIFALPFMLLNSIFLNILYIYKKTHLVLGIFLVQSLINAILNYLLIPRFSFFASSYITVFSEVFNFIILIVLYRKVIRKD